MSAQPDDERARVLRDRDDQLRAARHGMKIRDQYTTSVVLDNGLASLGQIAEGNAADVTPAEAQAVLVELEELREMKRRAKFFRDEPAPLSASRAAQQAARAETARKILGPLAGEA